MKIKIWNDGFKEIEVNENEIVNFRIINRIERTQKGQFKAFRKTYKIQLSDNLYDTTESTIKALQESLMGKYTKEKFAITEYKGYNERKANDLWFRMEGIKIERT